MNDEKLKEYIKEFYSIENLQEIIKAYTIDIELISKLMALKTSEDLMVKAVKEMLEHSVKSMAESAELQK